MNQGVLTRGRKAAIPSNVYTAFLAVSCLILIGSVLFVALKWIVDYQVLQ